MRGPLHLLQQSSAYSTHNTCSAKKLGTPMSGIAVLGIVALGAVAFYALVFRPAVNEGARMVGRPGDATALVGTTEPDHLTIPRANVHHTR